MAGSAETDLHTEDAHLPPSLVADDTQFNFIGTTPDHPTACAPASDRSKISPSGKRAAIIDPDGDLPAGRRSERTTATDPNGNVRCAAVSFAYRTLPRSPCDCRENWAIPRGTSAFNKPRVSRWIDRRAGAHPEQPFSHVIRISKKREKETTGAGLLLLHGGERDAD